MNVAVAVCLPPLPEGRHRMVILEESDFFFLGEDAPLAALPDAPRPYTRAVLGADPSGAISPLLSIQAVAEILMCSTKTVRRRIASGELPAMRDQGLLRVREDDLQAYLDGLQGRPSKPPVSRARRRAEGWSGLQ